MAYKGFFRPRNAFLYINSSVNIFIEQVEMAYKGFFRPRNANKYIGDPTNIIYRSRWELLLMSYLDKHPGVIKWGSEELVIPYRDPIDGNVHRYFPDFIVKKKQKNGKIRTVVIEVKPYKETIEPEKRSRITKKYLNEVRTWGKNQAKWAAAEEYCKDRGWDWQIMTEYELGLAEKNARKTI